MNRQNPVPAPLIAAWLVAVVSTLAALFIGEVLGQTPCVLCWFQRVFMFPLVLILGIALWRADASVRLYALPLAAIGGLIALWHTGLYFGLIPEAAQPCTASGPSCTDKGMAIFGVPIPLLSLGAFATIIALLATNKPEVEK